MCSSDLFPSHDNPTQHPQTHRTTPPTTMIKHGDIIKTQGDQEIHFIAPAQIKYDITATINHTLTQQQEQQLRNEATKRNWEITHIVTHTRHGRTQYVQDTTCTTEIDLIIPAIKQSLALEKALRLLRHIGTPYREKGG